MGPGLSPRRAGRLEPPVRGRRALRCIAIVALAVLLAVQIAGCRHVGNADARWLPSANHNARHAVIVVVHATEQASLQESLDTLRGANAGGPVSAHYLVGRDGSLYQLVDEDRRAWHAGGGRWGTITDLNSASIGIELDNDGAADFPPVQVARLIALLEDVCARNDIPRRQVIGHADLAPWRKRDPGPRFPWKALADAGFGVWPRADAGPPPERFDGWVALELVGYPMREPMAALRAFRMHFRGLDDAVTPMDAEDRRVLHGLVGEAWDREPGAAGPTVATPTAAAPSRP